MEHRVVVTCDRGVNSRCDDQGQGVFHYGVLVHDEPYWRAWMKGYRSVRQLPPVD